MAKQCPQNVEIQLRLARDCLTTRRLRKTNEGYSEHWCEAAQIVAPLCIAVLYKQQHNTALDAHYQQVAQVMGDWAQSFEAFVAELEKQMQALLEQ